MARKRNGLRAAIVYEVPLGTTVLRVRADGDGVLVSVPTPDSEVEMKLEADEWRALCDLRNVVLPRRRSERKAAQPEAAPTNGEATA